MKNKNLTTVEYVLRTAVFLTFVGHGSIALMGNASWIIYLETVGISTERAVTLLPIIGAIDLVVAFIILLKPQKYVILWAVIWAFSTALIRPLAGEEIWGFVERGGNWCAPLALFFLLKYKSNKI